MSEHSEQRFPACQAIIYACVGAFILQVANFELSAQTFGLWPIHEASAPLHGGFHAWQLLTFGFLHGSLAHLGINCLLLWMFGRVMEAVWGARAFISVMVASLLASGAAHLGAGLAGLAMGDQGVIGLSGGVAGVLTAYAVQFPRARMLLLLPPIPMYAPVAVAGILSIDGVLAIMGVNGISHAAHWGGALSGLICGLYLRVDEPRVAAGVR